MRNRTNEKLSRAKLLLATLQAAAEPNLVEALAEAVLLELGLTYRCFLHELAAEYGLTPPALASAGGLAAAMAEQQLRVAEVDELATLETERGWPDTLRAVAQVRGQAAQKRVPTKVKENLINILQVDENINNKLSYENCLEIYQALHSRIEHLRDMAQEW